MTLSPGARIGTYEIGSLLGAGGMGQVYRARDTALNRQVAIKVLPDAFAADGDRLARFTREAQVLAALNHPNIAAIYGIEANAIVMELVEGQELSELIGGAETTPLLAVSDALAIARQIADALEAAHDSGIIHRDLKPQNIKVRADGTVKILDFGLAKGLNPRDPNDGPASAAATMTSPAMTQMGMVIGTAAYMAPEQARGRPVDRRADIWAFGVVLYEMLSGRRAFPGDDVSITLANVLKEEVKWDALPEGLPPSIHRLLRRCLEKDPKRRLSAIGDARLELDDVTPAVASATIFRRDSRVPWVVAGAATVAAVALGWMALGRTTTAPEAVWTSIPAPVHQFRRGGQPAVSPDGRSIVFAAIDERGQDQLWIRALGEQSSRRIPGTENGGSPFWSPDSRSIAFFKDQKLQTVPVGGGTPSIIASAAGNARGGTWNRDGAIVFVPAPGLGLHQVRAASGGTAEPLAAFADAPGELSMYPSFLPDGQRFLYTTSSDTESWIQVGSLADGTSKKILKAYSRAEYAAGYLLFGSQAGLYAQPFDPARLTLSGERVRVVDSVGSGTGHPINYSFSVSANGSVLAANDAPYLPLSQLVWLDRSGVQVSTLGAPIHLFGFSVSPERTRLAVERLDPKVNSIDPWITDVATGLTTPLRAVQEGALASSPIWSHDGKHILHSSGYGTLRVTPVAGGEDQAWVVGSNWPLAASPDGTVVLVSQQSPITTNDVMAISMAGDHAPRPFLQSPFYESGAKFSPDGQSVAYVSNETGPNEVYLESFPKRGNRRQVSLTGASYPVWSEDGKELYFTHDEPDGTRTLMVASVAAGRVGPPQRVFGGITGFVEGNRPAFAVFDKGRRFLTSVLVPLTAPQVITVGQNWTAGLAKR